MLFLIRHRLTSVFDESQLNESRFMSLLENFLCDDTMHNVVEQLVNFIHGGYVETEEEKLSRLARVGHVLAVDGGRC